MSEHPEISRLKLDKQWHASPEYRTRVEDLSRMIKQIQKALRAEGFDGAFAERVISRVLYDDPNGAKVRAQSEPGAPAQ